MRRVMVESQGNSQFLTVAEVAESLRVSKMTVYRMVHSGELPAVRVGRSFRVPNAAVDQLIAEGLQGWDSSSGTGS